MPQILWGTHKKETLLPGFQINKEGSLSFFFNGKCQGVAFTNVYSKGKDVYAFVDHYAEAVSTRIVRAGKLQKKNLLNFHYHYNLK